MPDILRQEVATSAHTLVVKVGTRVLTGSDGSLDESRVAALAEELHQVMATGRKVALVTSGAVGAGIGRLGLTKRPTELAKLQAVAAVGQSHLMEAYDRGLRLHGRHAAQVLLTAEDLDDRTRYLNVRNTIRALFDFGAVPIINENDTVSVDELRTTFGDNDRLAAMVTNCLRAPLLVILSDVAGLYDGDPQLPTSQVISTVTKLDAQVYELAKDKLTGLSKGGMASKLNAARIATTAGESVIIASGRQPGSLSQILAGERVGTLFVAQGSTIKSWKRWIGFTVQPRGQITIDDGACRALNEQGRSLLAIGVAQVEGIFRKGDVVSIRTSQGAEIARGLTNYNSDDLQKIIGHRTEEIAAILGGCPYEAVVHRDNLAITGDKNG
jgi:glutamate 5-kinase